MASLQYWVSPTNNSVYFHVFKFSFHSFSTLFFSFANFGKESLRWLKWSEVKWSLSVASDSLRPHELQPTRLLCPWDSSGKSTGVGCHFLLQGIFLTQGSNLGLPHYRQTLYRLSQQGIPDTQKRKITNLKDSIYHFSLMETVRDVALWKERIQGWEEITLFNVYLKLPSPPFFNSNW